MLHARPSSQALDAEPAAAPSLTEDDVVQQVLHDDGKWHRIAIGDGDDTSCGRVIAYRYQPLRRESYQGKLCETCFTPFEISMGAELAAQAKIDEDAFATEQLKSYRSKKEKP